MKNSCQRLQATEFLWIKFQKQKKLSVDQILKFGYNFLEIGGLWSTYIDGFEKPLESALKPQNFAG